MAAIGGGVGGATGAGGLFGKTGAFAGVTNAFARGALRGILSSGITQGIAVATGLQKKFDWTGIAAAAIGGGVSSHVGSKLGIDGTRLSVENAAKSLGSGLIGGLANAGVRSLIDGTSFGDNILAALPDVIASTVGGIIGAAATEDLPRLSVDGSVLLGDETLAGGEDGGDIVVTGGRGGDLRDPVDIALDLGLDPHWGLERVRSEIESCIGSGPSSTFPFRRHFRNC